MSVERARLPAAGRSAMINGLGARICGTEEDDMHRLMVSAGWTVMMLAACAATAHGQERPAADPGIGAQTSTLTTPWGAPDLQGVWDYRSMTPLERPAEFAGRRTLTEAEAAEYERIQGARLDDYDSAPSVHAKWWLDYGRQLTDDNRTALIVSPRDGRLPRVTDTSRSRAAARAEARRLTSSVEDRSLTERCITFGVPSLPRAYNSNLQILQTPTTVALVSEMIHDARIVHLDDRPELDPDMDQWSGVPTGRWEGDTLVVESTHFAPGAFRGSSSSLRLVERFTRIDTDTMHYEVTVRDTETWEEPWTAMVPFTRTDQAMFEYACHEGNRGLHNILHNARFAENVPAQSSAPASSADTAADTVPAGRPDAVGLSDERLGRIDDVMDRAIGRDQISGAVTIVVRRGKLAHFEAHGLMDIEAGRAMRKDTIFPIASMTKPIAGVAVMMLVEEGAVRLSDPVSRFIPEFTDTQVAIPRSALNGDEPDIYTVPAHREITIRDLLTHTSGLVSGGAGTQAANRIAPRDGSGTVGDWVAALGAAPLDFQPGTAWAYSGLAGIDTLGRVVEVASGLTFDEFLRERIFEPLGMLDTGFNVPAEKMDRVVTLYGRTDGGLERRDVPEWVATTTLHSGGGGLWSTAEDYLQFTQMLVNRGALGDVRLLGTRTVELMATNHVGELFAEAGRTGGRPGRGFGLTMDVVLDAATAQDNRSTGSFGWSGAFGTTFWVDPTEEMTAILMVQTPGGPLRVDFQNAVRQAIVD